MYVSKQNALWELKDNIWITANAGCGKTTKLIERFLFLIQNNVKINEICCITYTEAAAKEMKARVIKEARKVDINIEPKQLRISTIHSFCKQLLESVNIITQNTKILNNNGKLMSLIIDKIISQLDNQDEKTKTDIQPAIYQLATTQTFDKLRQLIMTIIKKQNAFLSCLSNIVKNDKTFLKIEDIFKNLSIEHLKNALPYNLGTLVGNKQKIHINGLNLQEKLHSYDIDLLYKEVIKLVGENTNILDIFHKNKQDIFKIKNWQNIVLTTSKTPRKSIIKKTDIQLIKDIQNYYIDGLKQEYIDSVFSTFVLAYVSLNEYQKIKSTLSVITYDDILFEAFQLLNNSDFLNKNIDNLSIKHLMLDEAQDTNPISWKIIQILIKETKCNFFIVGDKKQSIYSFQGANVKEYEHNKDVFHNISKTYGLVFNDLIKLNTSFRSIPSILDLADKLCNYSTSKIDINQCFSVNGEKISHNTTVPEIHKKDTRYVLNNDESIFFENIDFSQFEEDNIDDINENGRINILEANESEWLDRTNKLFIKQECKNKYADEVAKRILKYIELVKNDINNGIIDKQNSISIIYPRGSTKGDFIFDVISILEDKYKINMEMKPEIYKKSIYFADLIAFFQFFILQNDNMNLACLLKSDFFGFTDDLLFTICTSSKQIDKNNTLWHKLQYQVLTNNEYNEKRTFAVETLKKILSCDNLIEICVFISSFIENKISLKDKYSHPFKLIEFACDKHKAEYNYDIRGFLEELNSEDFKDFTMNYKDETSVFFSTIHGVKGMEFDTVLLIDFEDKETNHNDDDNRMMFLDDHFWYKSNSGKIQKDDQECCEILHEIEKYDKNNKDEVWRLLYVAITRAKRRFVYFGNPNKSFYGKLFFHDFMLKSLV